MTPTKDELRELDDLCDAVVDRIAGLTNAHPSQNLFHTDLKLKASRIIRDVVTHRTAALEKENAELKASCITRIGKSANGEAFVVYLRDGQKITIGRGRGTVGAARLEVSQQAIIAAATTPRQEDGR